MDAYPPRAADIDVDRIWGRGRIRRRRREDRPPPIDYRKDTRDEEVDVGGNAPGRRRKKPRTGRPRDPRRDDFGGGIPPIIDEGEEVGTDGWGTTIPADTFDGDELTPEDQDDVEDHLRERPVTTIDEAVEEEDEEVVIAPSAGRSEPSSAGGTTEYGGMGLTGTFQTAGVGPTPGKLVGNSVWQVLFPTSTGVTLDPINGNIVVTKGGHYKIELSIAMSPVGV